jgi:hypothetical protein
MNIINKNHHNTIILFALIQILCFLLSICHEHVTRTMRDHQPASCNSQNIRKLQKRLSHCDLKARTCAESSHCAGDATGPKHRNVPLLGLDRVPKIRLVDIIDSNL